jgi:glycosyltransferase involved in cell wall biosynthesis
VKNTSHLTAEPLLSVLVPTFNHAPFIAQMLDGALAQRTNFELEIVVGDDASTDGSPAIIAEYAAKYPAVIRAFCHPHNLGPSQPRELGGKNNVAFLFGQCRGRYIALCEGDDFWTSSEKLQRQVDFLENHPEVALVHHQMEVVYQDGSPSHFFNPPNQPDTLQLTDLLADAAWHVATASTVFRNVAAFRDFPDWWIHSASGDLGIFILAAEQGSIRYFDEPMGVYRKHSGGMTNIHTSHNQKFIQNRKQMFEEVDAYFQHQYSAILSETIQKYQTILDQIPTQP